MSKAAELVSATVDTLKSFCSDKEWTQLCSYVTDIAKLHSIAIEPDTFHVLEPFLSISEMTIQYFLTNCVMKQHHLVISLSLKYLSITLS